METELESMIVRLIGDISEYQSAMEDAVGAAESASDDIEKAAEEAEKKTSDSFGKIATAAVSALTSLGGKEFLQNALHNFQDAEAENIKLAAAIRANGGAVEETIKDYEDFESQLESSFAVDGVPVLLAQAEAMGLTGDAAKRATEQAYALSAATGAGPQSLIRLTKALAEGNTELAMKMARMVPELRGVQEEEEFMAKVQKLVTSGMEQMGEEMKTTSGQMKVLSRDWTKATEDLGAVVAEGIKPLIDILQSAVDWFRGLSDEAKQTVTIIIGMIVVVGALTAAITVAGVVFNTMFAGAGVLIGVIVAAAAGIAAWAVQIGGVGEAWNVLKKAATDTWDWIIRKANEFWNWFKPIWKAIESLAITVWEGIQEAAQVTWDWITDVVDQFVDWVVEQWNSLVGESDITWKDIADGIQEAILTAEFVLRNFRQVVEHIWTLAKLGAISFANEVEHIFMVQLPEVIDWFANNWFEIITDIGNMYRTVLINMVKNTGSILGNMRGLIAGTVQFDDIWTPLTEGYEGTLKELPKITERTATQLENELSDLAFKQQMSLAEGLDEFIKNKRAEFATEADEEKTVEEAKKQGTKAGEEYDKAMGAQIKNADAVLTGSAEALSRVLEFQERIREQQGGQKSPAGTNRTDARGFEKNAPAVSNNDLKQTDYLRQIAEYNRELLNKPAIEFEDADL